MNQFAVSGNITREPEVFSPESSEYSVIKFSIANNDERKKAGDGWEDVVSFFDCEYWSKNPQFWLTKIRKGDKCFVHGALKQQTWETEGQKRSKVVLKVIGFPEVFEKKGDTTYNQPSTPAFQGGADPEENIPF